MNDALKDDMQLLKEAFRYLSEGKIAERDRIVEIIKKRNEAQRELLNAPQSFLESHRDDLLKAERAMIEGDEEEVTRIREFLLRELLALRGESSAQN